MRYLIPVLLLLAGCQTDQPATKEQAQKLGETCQAYGFKPGSNPYAECVSRLDQNRIASNQRKRRAIGMAMYGVGDDMQRNAAIQSANKPINCTSAPGMNGVVRTSCY